MSNIVLQRASTTHVFAQTAGAEHQHVWPLRVTATSDAPGLANEIFVMQAGDEAGGYQGAVFAAVASVAQMTTLATAPQTGMPFYRVATVEFACRSPEEAETIWAYLQEDARDLLKNWLAMSSLATSETATITET